MTRRRLLNSVSLGSLLLCALMLVLWVRDWDLGEEWSLIHQVRIDHWEKSTQSFNLEFVKGKVEFSYYRQAKYVTFRETLPPDGWRVEHHASLYVGYSYGPTFWARHGFGLQRLFLSFGSVVRPDEGWVVSVPTWLVASICALMPGSLLIQRRVARRIHENHCKICGYNLTGNTSGVCPECGSEIEGNQEPRTQ